MLRLCLLALLPSSVFHRLNLLHDITKTTLGWSNQEGMKFLKDEITLNHVNVSAVLVVELPFDSTKLAASHCFPSSCQAKLAAAHGSLICSYSKDRSV